MSKVFARGLTLGPFWFVLCLGWSWDGWQITDRQGNRFTFLFKLNKATREGHPTCWNVTVLWLDVMVGLGRSSRLQRMVEK